jgi:hypothetical protein
MKIIAMNILHWCLKRIICLFVDPPKWAVMS